MSEGSGFKMKREVYWKDEYSTDQNDQAITQDVVIDQDGNSAVILSADETEGFSLHRANWNSGLNGWEVDLTDDSHEIFNGGGEDARRLAIAVEADLAVKDAVKVIAEVFERPRTDFVWISAD